MHNIIYKYIFIFTKINLYTDIKLYMFIAIIFIYVCIYKHLHLKYKTACGYVHEIFIEV